MDIICFSHLRWDFVFQRPQHLLSRLSEHFRVFYVEEPFFHADLDRYEIDERDDVRIVRLLLKGDSSDPSAVDRQKNLLHNVMVTRKISEYISWYYTPMALPISSWMKPVIMVYDCMDELSAFKFAPPALKELERELMRRSDIVFTGGQSLYAAKKHQHRNIHPFPSSIDKAHFKKARRNVPDPVDQQTIPHPRIGFYGVIDERFDIDLVKFAAEQRPDWHFVLLGPVVKIDPAQLPKLKNIHYLGGKKYDELPQYLSGWDIAMICFALNESTKFISPTKTPEYLAGGKPVISTPIVDVVETYGKKGLVDIAMSPAHFVELADRQLKTRSRNRWLKQVDLHLASMSWEKTVDQMRLLIYEAISRNHVQEQHLRPANSRSLLVMKDSLPAAS